MYTCLSMYSYYAIHTGALYVLINLVTKGDGACVVILGILLIVFMRHYTLSGPPHSRLINMNPVNCVDLMVPKRGINVGCMLVL